MIENRRAVKECVFEYTGEIEILYEGDYIVRRNREDKYKKAVNQMDSDCEAKHVHLAGLHIKAYEIGMEMLSQEKDISANEFRMICLLLPHIKYNSGLCEHKNHKPITLRWLSEQMELQQGTAKKILLKLKSRGVIYYGGTGQEKTIFMNPYLFYRGRYINKTLEDMFKRTKYYTAYFNRFKNRQTP